MTANRCRASRLAAIATAVAAATLTAGLVAGCDSVHNSAGCFPNAHTIADSLIAIHEAGLDSVNDPARTGESIATIDKNLAEIGDKTDNDKVNKAVDDLNTSIADYNRAILNGDTNPDPSAINHAADELANACTS
jgi:hypothetical protein